MKWPLGVCPALGGALTMVTTMMMTTAIAEAQETPPEQIAWDLSELYPSFDAWDAAKAQLATRVEGLSAFRGRLGESAAVLREAYDEISNTEKELARLYVFAFLKADEDRRVSADQERRGLAAALLSEFGEAVSWVSPELLRVGSATIERYLGEDPGLEKHAFNIRNTLRQEPHLLDYYHKSDRKLVLR